MNIQKQARTLAMASMLALAVVSFPAARGTEAQGLTAAPASITLDPCKVACRVTGPTTGEIDPGRPYLQIQIVSTPVMCNKYDPSDPDVCSQPIVTANIRVSNVGNASTPATNLTWYFWHTDTSSYGGYESSRPVPALAPGQSENDSWQIKAYLSEPVLTYGSCWPLSVLINAGGAPENLVGPGGVTANVCNTIG